MYGRVILCVYQSRKALKASHLRSLRATTCQEASAGLGAAYQVTHRLFGTSEVTLCENKESSPFPPGVEPENEQTKSEDVKTEGDVKGDNSDPTQPKPEMKANYKAEAEPELKKAPEVESMEKTEGKKVVKTGKEGLLELLGAMKVDVTTKRRVKGTLKKVSLEQETGAKPTRGEMESTSSMYQQATSSKSQRLSPELVAAVTAAASTMPDRTRAESELLKQLRKHDAITDEKRRTDTQNIGNLIADMKVGKNPGSRQSGRPSNQIRFDDDGRGYTHDRSIASELAGIRRRKTAFSAKRLNIFSPATDQASEMVASPTLWDFDLANELVQMVNQRPRNGFEEMIHWTREGKLWEYPINNEAGMEEEANVPFHEHVFLQRHLEDGFPQQGPVRHFMELVVTGLSKNYHLTVSQKLEHIAWFRDYFQQNQEILQEAEA